MALTIQVDGLAAIKIASPAGGSLETLGYTVNGAEVHEHHFTDDVPGDENGGDLGPPIDIQHFGQMDIIRLQLTKWDELVANKIRAALAGGVAGTVPAAGSLYFQGGLSFRLLIHTTNRPRNYVNVVFAKEPKEINKGTKHSRLLVVGSAYRNEAGVLYNAVTS